MAKKKKEFGFGLDCIINGDSKEAEEIYKELGWYEEKPQIDEANKVSSISMNKVLLYLIALLFAWLSYIFIKETHWLFFAMFFTWYGFLKEKLKGD